MTGLRKDLPYLNGFLQEMQAQQPVARGFAPFLPWGIAIAGTPVVLATLGNINPGMAVGVLASMMAGAFGLSLYNRKLKQPINDTERFRVRAFESLAKFRNRSGPRRLRKSLHPAAAQVLEACALYRATIKEILSSPSWSGLAESEHWRRVRDDSLRAADLSMLEAIVCAEPFLGGERKNDGDFFRMLEDLLDGDFDDAFEKIGRAFGWERDEEFRHWESIPKRLHPAYNVATKLKKLALELEMQAKEMEAQSSSRSLGTEVSLDNVLQNLEQLRVAEKELEQQVRLGQ